MTSQMDDRLSDDAGVRPKWLAQGRRRTRPASAAFAKARDLLAVGALFLIGYGIVAGLIYAAVVWSLLAVIPLVVYLTAWLLVARG